MDNVETASHLFSFICGQNRCFIVEGLPLPLCQRCLGLYAGALLTAIWLLAFGLWRRTLPNRILFFLHGTLLLAAMLGGLHVIDPGPLWRLTFGLWTGHIVTIWLVIASIQLRYLSRAQAPEPTPWGRSDTWQALLFALVLPVLALAFPILLNLGWYFWTTSAILGVGVLGTAVLTALVAVAYYAFSLRRPRQY